QGDYRPRPETVVHVPGGALLKSDSAGKLSYFMMIATNLKRGEPVHPFLLQQSALTAYYQQTRRLKDFAIKELSVFDRLPLSEDEESNLRASLWPVYQKVNDRIEKVTEEEENKNKKKKRARDTEDDEKVKPDSPPLSPHSTKNNAYEVKPSVIPVLSKLSHDLNDMPSWKQLVETSLFKEKWKEWRSMENQKPSRCPIEDTLVQVVGCAAAKHLVSEDALVRIAQACPFVKHGEPVPPQVKRRGLFRRALAKSELSEAASLLKDYMSAKQYDVLSTGIVLPYDPSDSATDEQVVKAVVLYFQLKKTAERGVIEDDDVFAQ